MANNKNSQASADSVQSALAAKKTKKKKRVRTVAMTIVAALAVGAIVGLSVALYYSEDKNRMQASYRREMESVYARNYYDLLDGANQLDVTLNKLSAASTAERQQALLYETWSAATLAGNNLAAFENSDEGVQKANKFVAQLGDYSHYLAKRLSDGEPLGAEERQILGKLREMTGVFKEALQSTREGIDEGRLFLDDNGLLGDFQGAFSAFSDPSIEYPEMIYDGPFSDALQDREVKFLKDKSEITPEKGVELLAGIFPEAKGIAFNGETPGDIDTYNYTFECPDGSAFAQLSKLGGILITFNVNGETAAADAGEPEICAAARAFAARAGFGELTVVWCSSANGLSFVNLAPVADEALLYPDLIKVKLDTASGRVLGLDASHYAFNHVDRMFPAPALSESAARAKITLPNVSAGRLALIPIDETREVLTYEFECEQNGTYFVYIDAQTGEEVNILFVIDSDQGTVLM